MPITVYCLDTSEVFMFNLDGKKWDCCFCVEDIGLSFLRCMFYTAMCYVEQDVKFITLQVVNPLMMTLTNNQKMFRIVNII